MREECEGDKVRCGERKTLYFQTENIGFLLEVINVYRRQHFTNMWMEVSSAKGIKPTALCIALPPCNLPSYQLDATRAKKGKRATHNLPKFFSAVTKALTSFPKMWLYLPGVERLGFWC